MEVDEYISYTYPSIDWFLTRGTDTNIPCSRQQVWLHSGLVLYPNNCKVKLELYKWHLRNSPRNIAAEHFSKLLKEFPNDKTLIEYISIVIKKVNSSHHDEEVKVMKCLSETDQQDMYLAVATSQSNKLECTATVLQMMRAHPASIPQHGMSAATLLIKDEQQQGFASSVNPLRKILILELMPLILSKGAEFLDTLTDTVVQLFVDLVAHYYIECASITDPNIKDEYRILDPWNDLRSILVKFASLHKWSVVPEYDSYTGSPQKVYQKVRNFLMSCSDDDKESSGVFYCLLFLMFEYSFMYISLLDSFSLIFIRTKDKVTAEPASDMEKTEECDNKPVRKRRRTISVAECNTALSASFNIATTLYAYLRKHMLVKFERVRSELNPFSWRWYSLFLVDVAVYTGNKDYSKIVAKHMEDYPKDKLRVLAQEAFLSKSDSIFPPLWNLLENIPDTNNPALETPRTLSLTNPDRKENFTFILNSRASICLHICRSIVNLVKDSILTIKQSYILGLLLIIYQYDISQFRTELDLTISAIQAVKNFKYKGLLQYIFEIEVLEELLCLVNKRELRLDILKESKKRYIRDDVVKAIQHHVDLCTENSQDMVIRFLLDNKTDIESAFSCYKFIE